MIAIDGRALLESAPGGIQTATRSLIDALCAYSKTTAVVFVTRKTPPQTLSASLHIHRSNRIGLLRHAVRIDEPFDALVARFSGVLPDVVFAPTLQPIRTRKAPLVLVVHDCSFFRFPPWMSGKDRWWHRLLHPRRVIESAAAIICPSHSTRAELEYFVPNVRSRITVIPWGSPTMLEGKRREKEERNPYVIAIGSRHRRKNPELLAYIRKFLATMNPPHELVCIDPARAVTEEVKWQILAGARALIYPSFYEGFGIPPLEAMTVGIPVIASLSSSMVEVIGDAGLLVPPYAPEQWERALSSVLSDEPLRQSIIARGKERVSHFSWQRCAKEVLTVLQNFSIRNRKI